MDEFSSADILEKQNRKKKLAFLGVGLFEISFVLIIIIVLFGMLNYFNILSLSTLYPNQLAFLPHQAQKINKQAAISTPIPFTDYDWNNAQKVLEKFLRDNINPEFLPQKIQGEPGLIATDSGKGTEYEFGAKWKTNTNEFIAGFFHYGLKTNIQSDMEFIIQAPRIQDSVATAPLAKELTKKYLKDIPGNTVFACKTFFDKKTTYCGTMFDTPSGKKGFGVGIGFSPTRSEKAVLVISCFVPKNGIYYDKWTSCAVFN